MRDLTQQCVDKTQESENIKAEIKKQRLLRKELEEKIEMQEDARTLLQVKLNDLGKEIQGNKDVKHSAADIEQERLTLSRLKEKLAELK